MNKTATLAAVFASIGLLAGCNESPDAPAVPPPAPAYVSWAGNANDEVVKDATNENFKVRASDREIVFMGNMKSLDGSFVDTNANVFVNGVLIGSVSAATSTVNTQIAVFRCNNGRVLDFYNDTPATYTWQC